ncbi:MAG: SAF domain-containing protein [Ilumatobacter sp.]|uniref:SAF domain-containing protein n=1 Tax=Ilumatobacter sp. TaxID=1967498 RepID=UPI00260E1A00|nr:SAF domain-containing protein [Ilumatobacter sp.]MDJ0768005.1 SAF domain-containing protein [Ilumatobacter sp.]
MSDRQEAVAVADAERGREPRGFRPASRRRARIAAGAVLAAVAIGGNVLVYSSLDDKTEVVQVVRNVRAGDLVTSEDLRIVEVELDDTVPAVEASQIGLVVNQYARTFITSGTLIAPQLVQPTPLVSSGASVVAVEVRAGRMPSGLSERSRVMLVVEGEGTGADAFITTGRVVARTDSADSTTGSSSVSVEVAESDAAVVAAGNDVRIVLLDPGVDGALEQDGGG